MTVPKIGWIYVITCDLYDKEGIMKMGYTEKPDMLEEQVRSSLIQRYATTLISPRILALVKIAYPKEAEKALFEKLKEKKHAKEIFKCNFETDISPVLSWLSNEFQADAPHEIRLEILEKLLCRLRKKTKAIVRDLSYQRRLFDYIQLNSNGLYSNNQSILYNLMNTMPHPNITRSDMEWFNIPENANIIPMRTMRVEFAFTNPHNWDRKDPKLHEFLKKILDTV
jgi:hypothetical protein